MEIGVTALERAFQLARSGRVATVGGVKRKLQDEGYDVKGIDGAQLRRQLRAIMTAAAPNRSAARPVRKPNFRQRAAKANEAIPVEDLNASNDE